MMMPSVPTLRRMCVALELSSDVLLSLVAREGATVSAPRAPEVGEHPELSRIVHLLHGWPPERLVFLRKLLEVADGQLSP
jgi:hypothetical protein